MGVVGLVDGLVPEAAHSIGKGEPEVRQSQARRAMSQSVSFADGYQIMSAVLCPNGPCARLKRGYEPCRDCCCLQPCVVGPLDPWRVLSVIICVALSVTLSISTFINMKIMRGRKAQSESVVLLCAALC